MFSIITMPVFLLYQLPPPKLCLLCVINFLCLSFKEVVYKGYQGYIKNNMYVGAGNPIKLDLKSIR